MKKLFINWLDLIMTIFVTAYLILVGKQNIIYNDAIWLFLLYLLTLVITNAIKLLDDRHNSNANKINKINKRHKGNQSCENKKISQVLGNKKKEMYKQKPTYYKTKFKTDYEMCFSGIKFVIGMFITVILAIYTSLATNVDDNFREFSIAFFIDAYMLPFLLMLLGSFFTSKNFKKDGIDFFQTLCMNKKGKRSIIRGIFCSIVLVVFVFITLGYTINEFIMIKNDILTGIVELLILIVYLVYSLKSSV